MSKKNMTHGLPIADVSVGAGHPMQKLPLYGGAVGLAGGVLSLVFGLGNPSQLAFSYLVAFLFFLSLALGALFFVLIQFVTRAGWSVAVRRMAENVMGVLPIFALLFVPIALGTHVLYHWTHHDAVLNDALLRGKTAYLNEPFFYARAAFFLASWSLLGVWFRRLSVKQDDTGDHAITRRLQTASGPALILFAVSVTFASFDWIMSLDPHWFSTMFGVYFFSGSVVAFFALLALHGWLLTRAGFLRRVLSVEHFHDVGKLLFAFIAFWAYIAFSQYFLIWYANIPEETIWFAHRWTGSWKTMSLLLGAGHFAVPFFFLLPRTIKRKTPTLVIGAIWVLVMHYLDLHWLVMPVLHKHGASLSVIDLTTAIGVGGVFVAAVGWLSCREALVPLRDPRLPESLSFENV